MARAMDELHDALDATSRKGNIQAKIVADYMLSDILSHLEDVERTESGIKAMLYVIATCKPLVRMCKDVFEEIKQKNTDPGTWAPFKKRILLFSLAHYAFLGEADDIRLMAVDASPLEAFLVRLHHIEAAFGENMKNCDSFSTSCYEIFVQTVKQHVLRMLKKGEFSKADQFLRGNEVIKSNHREVLENMIKRCIMKEGLRENIMQRREHSYLAYYKAVAQFIHGLNESLEKSILEKLGKGYLDLEDSGKSRTSADDDKTDDVLFPKHSLNYRIKQSNSGVIIPLKYIVDYCRDTTKENEQENDEGFFQIPSSPTKQACKSDDTKKRRKIPRKRVVLGERFDATSSAESDTRSHVSTEKIVHTPELDSFIVEGYLQFGSRNWAKILRSFPFPSSFTNTKMKDRFRSLIRQNVVAVMADGTLSVLSKLLKEKLESARAKMITNAEETPKPKKQDSSQLKLDSYIVEGCLQFGLGNWAVILRSFPFPASCTNTKIKDRFRSLTKQNAVVVTPDGDLSVLSTALEERLPSARANMIPIAKQLGSSKSSVRSGKPRSKQQGTRYRLISPALSEGSLTSDMSDVKFLPIEDAYLVCGAMYLGQRWHAIQEYMDFRSQITVAAIEERWNKLCAENAVKVVDGVIECVDKKLAENIEEIAEQLRNKVLDCRRKNPDTDPTDTYSSDSEGPTIVKRRRNVPDSSDTEDQLISKRRDDLHPTDEENSLHINTDSDRSNCPVLNRSTDATTQTSKPKFHLQSRSPSTLEGQSTSTESSSEKSFVQLQGGSPTRPSTINAFKTLKSRSARKYSGSSQAREMRANRRKEQQRLQRRDVKLRKKWSTSETSALIDLLRKHPRGNWSSMLDDGHEVFGSRTPGMLKDKCRNLLRNGDLPPDLTEKYEI